MVAGRLRAPNHRPPGAHGGGRHVVRRATDRLSALAWRRRDGMLTAA